MAERKSTKVSRLCAFCGTPFQNIRCYAHLKCCSVECSNKLRAKPIKERFWAKVQQTDGCWLWTAASFNSNGYGQILVKRKQVTASRLSWELHYGDIPEGMYVCHKCDNPPCVRPDHLFLGTAKDNTQDMHKKRRHPLVHQLNVDGSIMTLSEFAASIGRSRSYVYRHQHLSLEEIKGRSRKRA